MTQSAVWMHHARRGIERDEELVGGPDREPAKRLSSVVFPALV